jgi:bifunctional non-homologous end joining protein LigD
MPDFIAPQLCKRHERPPTGTGWGHEIKFDGYRMQMRVERGAVVLRTRKGLDWTAKFPTIVKAGAYLPDCIIDGEIVALDHKGAPDFAALQAALSDGTTDHLVFFVFDLIFADGDDLREHPLAKRKAPEEPAAGQVAGPRSLHHCLCRSPGNGGRRGAALGVPHVAGGDHLQAARCTLPVG